MVILLNLDGTVDQRSGTLVGSEVIKVVRCEPPILTYENLKDEDILDYHLTHVRKHATVIHYTKIGDLEGTSVFREVP